MKVVVILIMAGAFVWFLAVPLLFPLGTLFSRTPVNRVEVANRTFGAVVTDVVSQVEAKSGKKIRILFTPESVADYTREKDGGVFGNPPVEGSAVDALLIACMDFRCSFRYQTRDTILFYRSASN